MKPEVGKRYYFLDNQYDVDQGICRYLVEEDEAAVIETESKKCLRKWNQILGEAPEPPQTLWEYVCSLFD